MASFVPVPTYTLHQEFITNLLDKDIKEIQFKNNPNYNTVLENLSREHGAEYLKRIETQFPDITFEDIRQYINTNDKYGGAVKTIFTMSNMKLLYCSPINLRYIYHALLILKYYQETGCKHIVELGQGYGGLFLAIRQFTPKFPRACIQRYSMIDLPMSSQLARKYLEAHEATLPPSPTQWETYDPTTLDTLIQDTFGSDETFFISNYCFTAIDPIYQARYQQQIIDKCTHGFLVWQTCFGADINRVDQILHKTTINHPEEDPQTGPAHAKNFYVWF